MEMVIALLGGAFGGTLISGISPRISVRFWISLVGGMAGGGLLFLISSKILVPGGAKITESADLLSLLAIVSVGFAGGVIALVLIFLSQLRNAG